MPVAAVLRRCAVAALLSATAAVLLPATVPAARAEAPALPLEAAARVIARLHIDRPALAAIPTADAAAFTAWLRSLDPYAHLDPAPSEMAEDAPRLGVVVLDDRGEAPPLVLPLPGGPAEGAGLTGPVRLLSVDGVVTEGAAGTVELARRAATGRTVVLKVRDAADAAAPPRHVAVTPGRHSPPLVERVTLDGRRIVRLHRFVDGETREALAAALDWARAGEGGGAPVILDLRWATGGHLLEAIDSISLFLPRRVPVATAVRAGEDALTYTSRDDWHRVDQPVIALTGPYTASSAEVLVRALAHHGWAVTAGRATYGKCVFQERQPLPGGASLTLTVGRLLDPAGQWCAGEGLAPHIPLDVPMDDLPAVMAALDAALGRMARVCREDLLRPDAAAGAAASLGWTAGVGQLMPVVLRRDTRRRLCLAPPMPRPVAEAVARDQADRTGRAMAIETLDGRRLGIAMPTGGGAVPAPVAATKASGATASGGEPRPAGYGVRIGSFRDPDNAARAARTVRTRHAGPLAGREVVSRDVALGEKGTWRRVYVVGFDSPAAARAFCETLGKPDCTGRRICRIPEPGTTVANAC